MGMSWLLGLRHFDPTIEVVIIRVYFDRRDEDRPHKILGAGNCHFLRKPFKTIAIKELIDSIYHGPSVRPKQRLSLITTSHLDSAVEAKKTL
jgi:hypothetical protein